MMIRILVATTKLFPLLLLAGCLAIDLDLDFSPNPDLQSQIIDQDEDLFIDLNPLQLNDEIKNLIDRHLGERSLETAKVSRLQQLLFDEQYLNIQYSDVRTLTAEEVFELRWGNCLSVMNLYVAMARYAGLDAKFQTVKVQPSWDKRGGMLVINQHINATGRFSVRREYVVDFTPEIALQQLTSHVVSDEHARALYFNNLGVESLIEGEYQQSLKFFKNALWIAPQLSIAWGNLGTAYNRLQNFSFAEYSYQMAFYNDTSNASAVNNLARFYDARGDHGRANEYRRAIAQFTRKNPYYHFAKGGEAFFEDDFSLARKHFRQALRLKKSEPDFYIALAKTYMALGSERLAEGLLASANELLNDNSIYKPSSQKVRFIDSASILRDSSQGISITAPGAPRFGN